LGLFAIADPLIVFLYGADFSQAGPILAVMGIVLISTYLNALLGKYFVSTDRQTLWSWVMAGAVILTIPLDLILVPLCQEKFGIGALGGSFSYLVTEGLMMVIGLYFLPKGILGWRNVWFTARILLAGLVMAGVAWFLRDYFILIPILSGGLVYIGSVLVLRLLTPEDKRLLMDLNSKILSRFRGKKLETL
jgi:O-antigen/teichoic acid export membrane protein